MEIVSFLDFLKGCIMGKYIIKNQQIVSFIHLLLYLYV